MNDKYTASNDQNDRIDSAIPADYNRVPGGLLIAFEGIDGSGKTTMARRTAQDLNEAGYYAQYLREPTDGPHGRRLREIMVSPEPRNAQQEFELFLRDRQDDVTQNIRPILNAGGVVCIDRYYISSMAYQGALGLDYREIQRANEEFAPVPDIILYFEIGVGAALERIAASREMGANSFEKRDYLERVVQIFGKMNFAQMVHVNAAATEEEVFGQIREIIKPMLSARLDN